MWPSLQRITINKKQASCQMQSATNHLKKLSVDGTA
jgi:hypothetical protein